MDQASFDDMMRTFLAEQPKWLIGDVKFFVVEAHDEPQMCLSTDAMKAFIAWALDRGIVGNRALAQEFSVWMDRRFKEQGGV